MRALLIPVWLVATACCAADFYVDPVNGSATGNGSAGNPWLTLQQVVTDNLIESQVWNSLPYTAGATLVPKNAGAPVKAGDTIWLRTGYHGELILNGWYNSAPITIRRQSGHTPRLRRASLIGASNWILDGLSISPAHAPTFTATTIITMRGDGFWGPAQGMIVRNCDVFCGNDASAWTAQDWIDNASTAFDSRSDTTQILNNTIRNTRYAIACSGANCVVRDNVIDGFSGDGIRGLGDYGVYEYNVVKNAIDVGDGHHDDGFQSWSVGPGGVGTGSVTGVVLRGNTFINHENPSHPMRTTMQGVGCFDGWFDDWVIENNVVITDHWHGITLLGARNCRIVNNTVIDLYTGTPGPSWIQIGFHKDGTPSEDCVIRNNLSNTISVPGGQTNIVSDHNILVNDPSLFFVDPAAFNLRLLETASAVDAGSGALAPGIDRDKFARPYGAGIDVGAYEWHPPGSGGGGSGGGKGDGKDSSCSTSGAKAPALWVLVLLPAILLAMRRQRPAR
ncbi:MAG: right-handed parallel beta-helix repeat-containing protein [Planctomycetes bacterium]|nr:right-handed parallel beta-helix repeat-containing protein [Planctomycetota bacterium]MCW8135669.1 right-handed parallel beta-helix repeat-containing protein [Planctomycetota bacterium]